MEDDEDHDFAKKGGEALELGEEFDDEDLDEEEEDEEQMQLQMQQQMKQRA